MIQLEPSDVFAVAMLLVGASAGFALQLSRARAAEAIANELCHGLNQFLVPPSSAEESKMDRACPFPACGQPIDGDAFLCRHCFPRLTKEDKNEAWKLYHLHQARKITKAKLRELQAELLAKYARPATATTPGAALAGVDRKQLERVCLLFEVYLAKDDEYRKCKPQFEDEKKRLGREHKKLREQAEAMIREILHPDNGQRALFDNTAPPKGAPNLPD